MARIAFCASTNPPWVSFGFGCRTILLQQPSTDALNGSGKRQLASPAVTTAVAEPQAAVPPAPTDEACQKFWKKRFLTRYQTE